MSFESEDDSSIELFTAISADTGDDEETLAQALDSMITEAIVDAGRNSVYESVEFYSTDRDQTMVVNEVESMYEDEWIDGDVHLVKVKVTVEFEYL